MRSGRWSPWAAAGAIPNLEIRVADLPDETGGGVLRRSRDRVYIFLDRSLSQAERRCVLAHELVHLERGTNARCSWHAPMWSAVVAREELAVDRIVATRLVPLDELRTLVERITGCDRGVTPLDVEDEFEVDGPTAVTALHELKIREARRIA